MSAYQLRTFKDIIDAVCEEVKIQATDTTTRNRIRRDINMIYLNEVAAYERWSWLRGFINLTLDAKITAGTASVTQNSKTVTLSVPPADSQKGKWFSTANYNERYAIAQHTAGSTTLVLDAVYTSNTSATETYAIWADRLVLPVNCRETIEVTQDFNSVPLEGLGLQKFRQYSNPNPKAEGRPQYYSTNDYVDPVPYSLVTNLPVTASRSSNGLLKTIVFSTDASSYLSEGDSIEISGCSAQSYNVQSRVASITTNTITYVGTDVYTESTAADTSITVKKLQSESVTRRYKELLVYPAINDRKTTLHVDFIKVLSPLENDSDEPLMNIEDRIVLFYGACSRAWSREGNPEEATRNGNMYDRKLTKMAGKLDDSTDTPVLRPSRVYLNVKRKGQRYRPDYANGGGLIAGGSSGAQDITGSASTVAIFDANGQLGSSPSVSLAELNELDGLLSKAVGTSDTQTLTNKTIDATLNTISNIINANIGASAAIAYSKLALTGSIVNADIAVAAAIAYSKLNLTGSIVNADINASAAIVYSKLSLANSIVNADIASSAAIVDTKLATISTAGKVSNSATTATSSNTNSAIVARDGSGNFSAGTITAALSGNATTATTATTAGNVSGVVAIANGGTNSSSTLSNNRVMQSSGGKVVEASAITAARALISDTNGIPTQSTVTSTELGYVSGVTSALQTQLNGKLGGTATAKSADYTITDSDGIYAVEMTTGATNRTVTLPAVATNSGRVLCIKKVDSGTGTLSITRAGSATIDGKTTITVNYINEYLTVQCDGTNWIVIGEKYISKSEVWLIAKTGFGSTNTQVVRFTTLSINTGSDLTATQSSTLGDSVTVNTAGIYNVIGSIACNNGADASITRNSLVVSNTISSTVLGYINNPNSANDQQTQVHFTGFFAVNDVIRLCGNTANANSNSAQLHVTRIDK